MAAMKTALRDTFVVDNLPSQEAWPDLIFDVPEVKYPEYLNAASALLKNDPAGIAIRSEGQTWTYREVDEISNKIARVLVENMRLVPGNRVLLRAPNSPMMAACWLAVLKAGGVVVATMPLLRSVELFKVLEKARVSHALCDSRMIDELLDAKAKSKTLQTIMNF